MTTGPAQPADSARTLSADERSGVNEVSAVVVTHNSRASVDRCLAGLAAAGVRVTVVDTASSDGTPDAVRSGYSDVELLPLSANVGFGAAANEGVAAARAPYVLVLNADAWPVGDAIEQLVAAGLTLPDAGAIGPRLEGLDGKLERSYRGFPSLWRLATEYLFLRWLAPRTRLLNAFYGAGFDYRSLRDAEFLVGAALLFRRDAFLQVGGFDPSFFMFNEEVDLCYRLRQAGWRVLFVPDATFVHVGGASTTPVREQMYREQLRSHVRFLAKHRGHREAWLARALLLVAMRVRGLVFRGERGRVSRATARWLAATDVDGLLEYEPPSRSLAELATTPSS